MQIMTKKKKDLSPEETLDRFTIAHAKLDNPRAFLTRQEIQDLLGIEKTTFFKRKKNDPNFPKPLKSHFMKYPSSAVQKYIDSLFDLKFFKETRPKTSRKSNTSYLQANAKLMLEESKKQNHLTKLEQLLSQGSGQYIDKNENNIKKTG